MPELSTDDAMSMLSARSTSQGTADGNVQYYSWHLSLRVDRPVEGCAMRPHAYMYSKKLDERDLDKPLPSHSKKMREPPPHHEFVYRWFRGPAEESCAYDGCPRRASFSPHDWSQHALGMRHGINGGIKQPAACRIQCCSTQSSLYMCSFCNSQCFVQAWKTQYTMPKNSNGIAVNSIQQYNQPYPGAAGGVPPHVSSRSTTPTPYMGGTPMRSPSFDETQSVGSTGSGGGAGASSMMMRMNSAGGTRSPIPPGTPRAQSYGSTGSGYYPSSGTNNYGDDGTEEWLEVSRDQIFIPGPDDIGRKLKLEAAAYSHDSGERLMYRVVKTDLVLARAPDPLTRTLIVKSSASAAAATTTTTAANSSAASVSPYGNPAHRFRVVTYNVLAEIYATQQQYPYCDFWALSWDYR